MNRWDDQGDCNGNLFASIMAMRFQSNDNFFRPATEPDVQLHSITGQSRSRVFINEQYVASVYPVITRNSIPKIQTISTRGSKFPRGTELHF
jgi:hypothetical protein